MPVISWSPEIRIWSQIRILVLILLQFPMKFDSLKCIFSTAVFSIQHCVCLCRNSRLCKILPVEQTSSQTGKVNHNLWIKSIISIQNTWFSNDMHIFIQSHNSPKSQRKPMHPVLFCSFKIRKKSPTFLSLFFTGTLSATHPHWYALDYCTAFKSEHPSFTSLCLFHSCPSTFKRYFLKKFLTAFWVPEVFLSIVIAGGKTRWFFYIFCLNGKHTVFFLSKSLFKQNAVRFYHSLYSLHFHCNIENITHLLSVKSGL